jgi:hypothetical protein
MLTPGKTNCYIKCTILQITNLHNLWSHLHLKIPMRLQFSSQIFTIKWLASLSMLYSQLSQENFLKKIIRNWNPWFPFCRYWKTFLIKMQPHCGTLIQARHDLSSQINEISLKYLWCKLHWIISSKNANPRQDQLLYKVYKFAGYKFTRFVESPTFENSYAFAVFFKDFDY